MKAIIFDMDGVLVDSPNNIWKSFRSLLKDHGVDLTWEDHKRLLGTSLKDRVEKWNEEHGLDLDYVSFSDESAKKEMEMHGDNLNNIDLSPLMNELKKKGIKIGVATSSPKERTHKILELLKIKDLFDTIVTSEDVQKHKPNPDVFLKAAENMKCDPEHCVVIEDALSGIEGAKRGGMKAIGMVTNFYNEAELIDGNADLVINSLTELPESLNKLMEENKK